MQLDQLLPEQATKNWRSIELTIRRCLPPGTRFDEKQALLNINKGTMQAWVLVDDGVLVGVVTTMFLRDALLGVNQLLIYSAYVADNQRVRFDDYAETLPTLLAFAKANGCREIVAYSNIAYLAELTKLLGFTQHFYFTKEVEL